MVFLTNILGYVIKVPRKHLRDGFIDSLRLNVKGGTGGSGLPRYGGKGGSGGNVYVMTKKELTLRNVKKKWKKVNIHAEAGTNSSSKGILGKSGSDIIIEIPCGITIFDDNGLKLGDLNKDDLKLLVAKGGLGGCPETGFCGQKGQTRTIILDLKLIADVGLVGFPNAGKSTFLHAMSKARPKIARYPFTTLKPQLGTMIYNDLRQITVADLPGLIEGAHVNIGMGHKFLKHIERTKLLLFIVDIQGFQLSVHSLYRTFLDTVILLNKEIELYKPDLLNTPSMLIINKMDTNNADKIYADIKDKLEDLPNVASEYPEEIRPDHVIEFDDIVTASLALKKKNEIEMIKEKIRNILDINQEKELISKKEIVPNSDLHEKLKQQVKQIGPTLV
ncbi:GTP-binding protein 10 homolog isoform X1 [Vespa velutina]|uniref:GTP-binding protein 10 homolog isoform X1 n=2 Tax=Vespa velutina TaxID=202808 RepID=UPI001FB4EA17|nr:GTP-binding protein 10 homolog isoform X1 [Vespa velutina]